jgi:hypothetical protein
LLDAAACHQETQESDAHACCEEPPGVQAVADECCDSSPNLVLASTDVREIAPPTVQASHVEHVPSAKKTKPVAPGPASPSPSLDRTTVLLI